MCSAHRNCHNVNCTFIDERNRSQINRTIKILLSFYFNGILIAMQWNHVHVHFTWPHDSCYVYHDIEHPIVLNRTHTLYHTQRNYSFTIKSQIPILNVSIYFKHSFSAQNSGESNTRFIISIEFRKWFEHEPKIIKEFVVILICSVIYLFSISFLWFKKFVYNVCCELKFN